MQRLPFAGIEVFLAIAEHGSLRRAAEMLGLQPPAVSQQLKMLEERVGTVLFTRTTRSVQLTEAGRAMLSKARPAMGGLAEAIADARNSGGSLRGPLRISLPYVAFEIAIAPRLRAFQTKFPQVELELVFDEAFVDIAAGQMHAGIRLGDHLRGDSIAVRLTPPLKQVVFGAPEYFDSAGRPRTPADLLQHSCVRYRYIASTRLAEWAFSTPEGVVEVDVTGPLIVNSTTAMLKAAREGLGLGWLFGPNLEADLKSGRLECVLEKYAMERPGYFLYFPRSHSRIDRLRVFSEFFRFRADSAS